MTQVSQYGQQAIDFLTECNATYSAEYIRTGKHFDGDKEDRDIYKCTIKRGNRSFSCQFGQSIADSGYYTVAGVYNNGYTGEHHKPTLNATVKNNGLYRFSTHEDAKAWRYKESGSRAITKNERKAPTSYDFLACLTKHDPGSFEDFCSEFGYDTDSRKAEKTYHAVVEEWKNVSRLFNDEEIEKMQEIQ